MMSKRRNKEKGELTGKEKIEATTATTAEYNNRTARRRRKAANQAKIKLARLFEVEEIQLERFDGCCIFDVKWQ